LTNERGMRRVQLLLRELFPTPDGIRYWQPRAGASRRALLWAYVRRPFYLVRHLPAAYIHRRRPVIGESSRQG
jgi:hypothetical protein